MDPSYWKKRWDEGQIGFHRDVPNEFLERHHSKLGRRVFVPLAGKALDMRFLAAAGHDVVGCEIVDSAVHAFFDEAKLKPSIVVRAPFRLFSAGGVKLWCGDVFKLRAEDIGIIDGVYDRAALVALTPDQRAAYVDVVLSLLRAGGSILLVTFSYDQSKIDGPPFSVDDDVVHALFSPRCDIEKLEEREEAAGQKYLDAGVTSLREAAFLLRKR